jgi:ABC-type Fe3+-hydroxamate transport system substrate-binding protein
MVLMSLEDAVVQRVEALKKSDIKIHFFSKNENFEDIIKNYTELAKIIKANDIAKIKLKQYKHDFELLKNTGNESATFIVSASPLIVASGKSYIGDILRNSGYKNEFENLLIPYPVISMESLLSKKPEFIFVMDRQAYDYLKKHSALSKLPSKMYYVGADNSPYYTLFDYIETMKILTGFRTKK